MATNNMTAEQDLLTREFFQRVSNDNSLFPNDPVGQRNMNISILRLLNYDYVNGAYIECGKDLTRSLTGQVSVECEWEADVERVLESLNETSDSKSTDQTDSSKSSKDSEVRETVLREDV